MPDQLNKWRAHRLGDLFEIVPAMKVKGKATDFPKQADALHRVALLTASTRNRGISGYAKEDDCPIVVENVISISRHGAGVVFYHDSKVALLQDVYVLMLKNQPLEHRQVSNKIIAGNIPHKAAGLFLSACLNKVLADFNWSNKSIWKKVRERLIFLPSDSFGNVDYNFMQSEISRLAAKLKEKVTLPLQAMFEFAYES